MWFRLVCFYGVELTISENSTIAGDVPDGAYSEYENGVQQNCRSYHLTPDYWRKLGNFGHVPLLIQHVTRTYLILVCRFSLPSPLLVFLSLFIFYSESLNMSSCLL
jgi:hypothetical protein